MSQPFDIITDPDVEARRKARAEEYGTWECGPRPIEFGGARAFNEGEPVPKSTVERIGLDNLGAVVPAGTFAKKTADEADARAKRADEILAEDVKSRSVAPKAAAKTTTTEKGGSN